MILPIGLRCGLDSAFVRLRFLSSFCVFHFILFYFIFFQPQSLTKSSVNSIFMHCSQIPQIIAIFLLKIDPTALFIYLKIISLQCFIFQFSVSVQISCIQMDQSKLHFYTQGFLLSSAQKA